MAGGGGGGGGGGRLRRTRSAGEARAGAVSSPPRRRSERNTVSTAQSMTQGKPCLPASKMVGVLHPAPLKTKPITLKKIVPRNRQIKESTLTPRRSPRISSKEDKENVPVGATMGKSPGAGDARAELKSSPPHRVLTPEAGKDVLSPATGHTNDSSLDDERDQTMAKRVRRSYSRLEVSMCGNFLEKQASPGSGRSDTSTPNHGPGKRQTLFGFEKLLVSDGLAGMSPVNANTAQKGTASETYVLREPDTDIPGISFVKEKRRKKKIPQFDKSELEEWMAQMNAEFEEAEKFNLLVE